MSFSKSLTEKRDAALAKAEAIVEAAQAEARELTPEQDADIAAALDEVRSLDEQIATHSELEKRSAEAAELRKEKKFDAVVAPAVVKSEARTYSPNSEASFVADAYAAQFNNDFSAKDRLARHMNEEKIERRDVTSANFAGLVVPQFLTDLAAPFARAGRPFLDVARKHQLPASGLTISISKVTTGSATAVQTEGAAVQETNMDDTKLDVSVVTVAGQQNVSRQALERGTGIDSLVMADLVSAYNTNLDSLFVTTSATSLTNVISQVVTYTDASPTVAELYPKLLDAVQRIQTNYFGGPNFILMHPRRLAWILAALDTTNRPLAE
jgi:HK97 family phage major capsid protein